MGEEELVMVGASSSAIDSSNIGFQLLKKQGWTQGTGLGASQQGRLEPVEAYLKDDSHNTRGLGAYTSRKKILPVSGSSESSDTSGKYKKEEEDTGKGIPASSCSSTAINSSNIGFQLLKKHGWKEGTGLGISEQGRLEPVQTYLKNNKRGLGSDKLQKALKPPDSTALNKNDQERHTRKNKALSKKMRKMQESEKRVQEKEFEQAFFREFWPDNV